MAEWLCSGLQSRVHRFDSGSSLQLYSAVLIVVLVDDMQGCISVVKGRSLKTTDVQEH